MARYLIGQNGIVENIVESDTPIVMEGYDVLPESLVGPKNVGDTYDLRDVQMQREVSPAVLKVLTRHENLIRQLVRALRATSTAANTQANNAGLPTSAASPDLTDAQARDAFKGLLV